MVWVCRQGPRDTITISRLQQWSHTQDRIWATFQETLVGDEFAAVFDVPYAPLSPASLALVPGGDHFHAHLQHE